MPSHAQSNLQIWMYLNYLLTSDFSGPVYNRFPRGECITWVSGGEGALDTPGTSEARDKMLLKTKKCC
jgi:hypothetical protein